MPLPEPVEDRMEVVRVQVQAENIILLLAGVHHLRQPGVGELGESLPGRLEYLTTNVQLHPGHLRYFIVRERLLFCSLISSGSD